MKLKYGKKGHITDCDSGVGSSSIWRRIIRSKSVAESHIKWIVGEGSLNFWKDSWWSDSKIGEDIQIPENLQQLLVKDTLENSTRREDVCFGKFSRADIDDLKKMKNLKNVEPDRCIWTANPSGDFSIKSAWELCRQRDQYQSLSLNIWHHLVPLKWSFLTWSAINQGVPLDDCLCKKGFQMVYKCNCCDPAHCESINHIFVTGNLAQQLWSYFENKLHISGGGSMLHHKLSGWWIAKVNSPSHKAVLSLIPNSICWELWCSRNKGRFEGKSTQVAHVIRHIEDQIKTILVKSKLLQKHLRPDTLWPHQFGISVPSVMRDSVIITSWHKPEEGWVKLNSDGCAKGNPGLAAGGSIVRTDSGSVLWGAVRFLRDYF